MNNHIDTNCIPLGNELSFENSRLHFGEGPDATSAALATFDDAGCHAADLDLSRFRPCYDLVRHGILDLASRGEVPGLTYSVTIDLDKLADTLGYDGDDNAETRARYALDGIRSYSGLCAIEDNGSNFSLLSIVGTEYGGHGRYKAVIMSPYVNRLAADALARKNQNTEADVL